jgi:hypothetical protein
MQAIKTKKNIYIRPTLTQDIAPEDLKNFYWLKRELTRFCSTYGLPTAGNKREILLRIGAFLKKEEIPKPSKNKQNRRDSDTFLTPQTEVIYFKNDAKTRAFFTSIIGPHFHFTVTLQNLIREKLAQGEKLLYQDLINAWVQDKQQRKDKLYKSSISPSCEYNQFIRDYLAHERKNGKTFSDAIAAWKIAKKRYGSRVYVPQE